MVANMAEAAISFHCFGKLPIELRLSIWRECLPHRIVELDTPEARYALDACFDDDGLPICDMRHTTKANSVPPLISRVCHEARAVALERGHRLPNPGRPCETTMLDTSRSGQWFDPSRDIVHMNFTPVYDDPMWADVSCGNPLPYFLKVARRAAGASIQDGMLQCSSMPEWRLEEHLETLREYFVCFMVVCLHVDLQSAIDSGLFAVDNRIAMVSAWDYPKIAEFRRLWEAHGSHQDFRTADFFKRYVDDKFKVDGRFTVKQLLEYSDRSWVSTKWDVGKGAGDTGYSKWEIWEDEKDDDEDDDGIWLRKHRSDHPWVVETLSRKPTLHPTIMIRLCTRDCYASLSVMPQRDFTDPYWPVWKS